MSSHEVTPQDHAKFLAAYQGAKGLTKADVPTNSPPMTCWSDDRNQVVAVVLHDAKGDRYFVCPRYDNKSADQTKDTPSDVAMRAGVKDLVLVPQTVFNADKAPKDKG